MSIMELSIAHQIIIYSDTTSLKSLITCFQLCHEFTPDKTNWDCREMRIITYIPKIMKLKQPSRNILTSSLPMQWGEGRRRKAAGINLILLSMSIE